MKGDLAVVVTNTDPLLFQANQTSSTQADSDQLATLKQFIGGFGSFGVTFAASLRPVNLFEERVSDIQKEAKPDSKILSRLRDARKTAEIADRTVRNGVITAADALKTSVTTLTLDINSVSDRTDQLVGLTQRIELNHSDDSSLLSELTTWISSDTLTLPKLDSDYAQFAKRKAAFADAAARCQAERAAALRTLDAALTSTAAFDPSSHDFVVMPKDLNCGFVPLTEWLVSVSDRSAYRSDLSALQETLQTTADAIDKTAKSLPADRPGATQASLTSGAAALIALRERAIEIRSRDVTLDAFTVGVLPVKRPIAGETDLAFGKVVNESFQISSDDTFKSVRLRRSNNLTESFTISKTHWYDLDFDLAGTYTTLHDDKYSAVASDPTNTQSPKTIQKTGETTLAGEVVLLGTLRQVHVGPLMPQIGVTASTDHPGLFFGLAYPLGKFIKISAGEAAQFTSRLDHQRTGLQVTADSDIKTHNELHTRPYVALSFTLNSLSLFSSGGSSSGGSSGGASSGSTGDTSSSKGKGKGKG